MNYDYSKIPSEMKELKRWVLWKKKKVDDNKTTKIPVNAKNGYGAKSNDENTWVTFDEAVAKVDYFNCDGLGFMLGNGYFGIDLDNEAVKQRDKISEDEYNDKIVKFKELISEFVNSVDSFTEISQSGYGVHIICKGVLPVGARRKGSIEMYDNARFFAMTGKIYKGKNYLNDCTESVKPIWEKYLGDKETNAYVYQKEKESNSSQIIGMLTDNEVIEKAKESQNGNLFTCLYYGQWEGIYPSQSEADMAFCSLLAFWCGKNEVQMDRIFRNSKLYRDKWDKKRGQNTYGEITIHNAISKCRDVYNPGYNNTQSYNPVTGEVVSKVEYDLNDTGNARRFVDRFGSTIRWNCDNNCWLVYDGKTWIRDSKQIVKTQADLLIEEMKVEMIREQDENLRKEKAKNIKHLSNSNGKEAMLKEVKHISFIPTVNSDYNRNDYLLNCKNGIVDLKTGKLLPHDKSLMLSKNTNINCSFEEPERWKQFLLEIFNNNQNMVDYIQCAIGLTLTGDTREQCFFQCYGDGSNGKSVFLDVLYSLMGDYALNTQIDSILAKAGSSGGASSEIARMDGARFIRTNEPNEGSRFNEGLIKQLTSGEVTTARYLYGREFEFIPKFKLWMATNYKIIVRGTDHGIWRRMRLVPFEVKFEGKKIDKYLTEKLMAELPQILGWAVKGVLRWQKEGLVTPKEIELATKSYKTEMDQISNFLKDAVRITPSGKEKASVVYREFSQWAKTGNEDGMSQTKFGTEMSKRFEKKNIGGYVHYVGFVLKKNDKGYIYTNEE